MNSFVRGLRGLVPREMAGRAAVLSLISNFLLMLLKLVVAVITGSIAVLSDAIDSVQDVIASGIVFVSVRVGARPPDLTHPYGHGRAETIAAALQALLITAGGAYITYRAIQRLFDPPEQIGTDLGLATMALAAAVNFGVFLYASHVARRTRSPAIAADARHLLTNVVQALAIVLGLALVAVSGEVTFDTLAALLLAAYLFWTAGTIFKDVAGDILDVSLSPEELQVVEQCIRAEGSRVNSFHDLRSRRSGQHRYVDFHLVLQADMSLAEAHTIADRIQSRVRQHWPTAVVTIHTEPAEVYVHHDGEHAEKRGE